jgi:DNA-3-methyladenine glycosylase I
MMTAIVFMSGLSRQVVMGKWDGFLEAFEGFDVDTVAGFGDVDVERLSQDTRIVRYKAKIRAVVDNAGQMRQIAAEHGSFGAWLQQSVQAKGADATAVEVGKRFKYISTQSAGRFLYAVGEDVGEVPDEIRRKYGPG